MHAVTERCLNKVIESGNILHKWKKIEDHLKKKEEIQKIQAGFTTGARTEDNIFILQYCIEQSYREKNILVITFID